MIIDLILWTIEYFIVDSEEITILIIITIIINTICVLPIPR